MQTSKIYTRHADLHITHIKLLTHLHVHLHVCVAQGGIVPSLVVARRDVIDRG